MRETTELFTLHKYVWKSEWDHRGERETGDEPRPPPPK